MSNVSIHIKSYSKLFLNDSIRRIKLKSCSYFCVMYKPLYLDKWKYCRIKGFTCALLIKCGGVGACTVSKVDNPVLL